MVRMGFRAVLALEVVALVAAVVVLSSAFGAYRAVLPVIPQPRDIELYQPKTATVLYDVHGAEIARVFEEDRELVDLDDVPAVIQNATIAIEDKRFYPPPGVDPIRMAKVILLEMDSGGQSQGASTITMQHAREIYLSKTKLFGRKVQELGLAINIARVFSKREILEMYLNQVCYGDGAYGIKAAARRFYQKALCELELHEAALLVGLPNNPEGLSPYDNPGPAKTRRDRILSEMAAQGFITRGEAEAAKAKDLGVKPRSIRGLLSFKYPYFTEYAVQELIARYGKERVYGGGLRVYTTLNPELQERTQELLTAGVNRHRGARVRQGAAVLMDPQTGHIFALVGGTGWSQEDQYNRAVLAERQPGSAMKPFVWTTALEYGFTPDTTVPGSACAFDVGGGLVWAPRNCGGGGGTYTLATGLQNSVNIVSARLTMSVGPEAVVRTAKKMGIRSNIRPFPSIALGTEGVTPLDMATAYCCFANGGYRVRATTIDKVYDHNHILLDAGKIIPDNHLQFRQNNSGRICLCLFGHFNAFNFSVTEKPIIAFYNCYLIACYFCCTDLSSGYFLAVWQSKCFNLVKHRSPTMWGFRVSV